MDARTLSLAKGRHKYIIRYNPGGEQEVLDEIARLASDPGSNLDWLDAATLSFQVAHHAAAECYRTIKPTHGP